MHILAPAKINMGLKVVGQLENGYHTLDMIMVPISLYDEIFIEKSDTDEIYSGDVKLPEKNTISKMIQVFRDTFNIDTHYKVNVVKNIPMQSGMAGGSSDAAAVLACMLQLENITCSMEQQFEMGKKVGADVPFCIYKKWARVQGIGEIITPIDSDYTFNVLLVKPSEGVDTPSAFKLWHEVEHINVDLEGIQEAIINKDYDAMIQTMGNDLEKASFSLAPVIPIIKQELMDLGMDASMMSGSGSTVIGFSQDLKVLENAKQQLQDKYSFVEIVKVG